MSNNIRTQVAPNLSYFPKVNGMNPNDFNSAIWENGFKVRHDRAVVCPCKLNTPAADSRCHNCLGSGWVFINPIETQAFITSINKSTTYKEWSPQFIGTVAVTMMNSNRVSFMDRITLLQRDSIMSEGLSVLLHPTDPTKRFVFCTYPVEMIESIFVLDTVETPLTLLNKNQYYVSTKNPFIVEFVSPLAPVYVSITYRHKVTYNVIDIPHDFRISRSYDDNGKKKLEEMPVQAIARKTQYGLGKASNYEGDNILNNSYLE